METLNDFNAISGKKKKKKVERELRGTNSHANVASMELKQGHSARCCASMFKQALSNNAQNVKKKKKKKKSKYIKNKKKRKKERNGG